MQSVLRARKEGLFLRIIMKDGNRYLGWFVRHNIAKNFADELEKQNQGLVIIEDRNSSQGFRISGMYKYSFESNNWLNNKKARQEVINSAIKFHENRNSE